MTLTSDAALGYPLLKWLDGIGQIVQRLNDLALDNLTTGDPGWSIIFDPDRCPTYALPWLAQCVGVRFDTTQNTDATQRAAIRGEQAFQRGTLQALQAAANKYLVAGQVINIYERTPDPYSLTVVISLPQIAQQTFAQIGATYATFAAYKLAFSTFSQPAYAQAQITAALQAAKPAGLIMTINVVTGPTFAVIKADFATFATLKAAIPLFSGIPAWT